MFTDNLFISKMKQGLSEEEHKKAREAIMVHVRKVVPKALIVAVLSGMYLFSQKFGPLPENLADISRFQVLLGIKASLGLWLGFRGVNQVFFGIQPWIFKSHVFPFILVIIIIFLSQLMYI